MSAVHLPGPALTLVVFYVLLAPLIDRPLMQRLKANPSSRLRVRLYRIGVASSWAFSAVCGFLWRGRSLRVAHLPREPGWIFGAPWHTVLLWALLVTFFALGFLPGVQCLLQPRRIPGYTKAARKLAFFLPATPLERRWFALVSVTAGVCEEWIFRGYLLSELQRQGGCSLTLALAVSTMLFGWNHLYQGWANTLKTGAVGLIFGLLAILTAGLGLPMLLHTLMDLQVLIFFRPEQIPVQTTESIPEPRAGQLPDDVGKLVTGPEATGA